MQLVVFVGNTYSESKHMLQREIEPKESAMMVHYHKAVVALLIVGSISILGVFHGRNAHGQETWPQFRGVGSLGVGKDSKVPDRWSATENVAWKTDIPGRGWSSPVVWGNRIFLTTVINTGEQAEAKKGLYFGGERPKPAESVHQWRTLCLDLNAGTVLWDRQVHEGVPETPIHIKSSYASETAVTDGERVYFCFGSLGIYCFDFEGNEVWQRSLPRLPTRFGWGAASSPTLHDGRLYYCNDNEKASMLMCLDAKTGNLMWEVPREEKSNWSTPFVWKNEVRTEIITPGTNQVRSYDLDGQLLWSLTGMSSITIATPYAVNGLLYVSSGYVMDPRRPILAIRPGASGDITLPEGETSSKYVAWSQPKAAPYNPTTLVHDGRLYVLYDRGIMSCYNATTGEEIYRMKRLPESRAFTSSPWAVGDRIFCLSEDGVTSVLKAGDEFEVLHTNPLQEDDMGMATPAIVNGKLLLRTAARLYCIGPDEK
jgi:outer membrane protein assembly factor BamB